MKDGEKNFYRVFFTSFYSDCGESRWLIFFSWHSWYYYIKALLDKWLKPLTSWLFPTPFSIAPTLKYFYHISCEFKKKLETNAVNFCQKCDESAEKNSSRISNIFFAANAVNRGELFVFTAFSVLFKKTLLDKWLGPLTSWMFSTPYSTAPTLMYFYHFSCEFNKTLETESSEFLSEMRWKGWKNFLVYFLQLFAANAVNRGELFIFTAFSVLFKKNTSWQVVRISYLPDVFNSLFHCANSHVLLSYFLWN